MSTSLYCRSCRNYIGHYDPDVARDYDRHARYRRDYNVMCRQCEAEEGLYEGRIHARDNWNMSMRGHAQVIAECRRTVSSITRTNPNLSYSIGRGGYTVLEPKQAHSAMLYAFTDQDALCLLEFESRILTSDYIYIRDYHVSENFAIWVALMRHVECSKMNRREVARILDEGVRLIKERWPTWDQDLMTRHLSFLTQSNSSSSASSRSSRSRDKGDRKSVGSKIQEKRKSMMSLLGKYYSKFLNRGEAQGRQGRMGSRSIPSTP